MFLVKQDRIRAVLKHDITDVRVLLKHPMQPYDEIDAELDQAGFIQVIQCWRNDEEMLRVHCSPETSENPYFAFQLTGGELDDVIRVRWVDNQGRKGIVEAKVR